MLRIAKKRWLDSFLKLILLSGIIHFILMLISVLITKDFTIINYFNILDLDILFPKIIEGPISQILSISTAGVIYILLFLFYTKKND